MLYTIIVAVDIKGGISKNRQIPWHYREDFQWFKEKTAGKCCIMGKGTFEDIKARSKTGEVLPGRFSWVVTSQAETYDVGNTNTGTLLYPRDIENYIHTVEGFAPTNEVMVLGGMGVYVDVLNIASVVHLTHIKKDYECDQIFPVGYVYENFERVYNDDSKHPDLEFNTYIRRLGA